MRVVTGIIKNYRSMDEGGGVRYYLGDGAWDASKLEGNRVPGDDGARVLSKGQLLAWQITQLGQPMTAPLNVKLRAFHEESTCIR